MLHQGRGKEKKQKAEPVTVVKKKRRRNFIAEEVQVIMQEAGKNTTVIKRRFTPTITSEAKEKVWISITKSVNSINGKGDSESAGCSKEIDPHLMLFKDEAPQH